MLPLDQRSAASYPPDYFNHYHSPFEYRYGSDEMRSIWSEQHRWETVRQVWLAAAEAQQGVGLVTADEVANLRAHIGELDVQRIFNLEKSSGHDIAAAIAEFGEKAPIGGRILHQGMTSEDVLSNAEMMRIHEAFGLIGKKLDTTLLTFADRIAETKDTVCMGWTHLQAAEPTTVGYRLARYAQDLLVDRELFAFIRTQLKGKGVKGAVGTSASFAHLLQETEMTPAQHEAAIMEKLGIPAVLISGQTYPRKFDFFTIFGLASLGQSLHQFGLDVQVFQSSPFAEWAEPRRTRQVGSSAMPHKQNPIHAENLCSLTAGLPGKLMEAWMIGATITGERTLRDSAGKRSWLPESFLIVNEALTRAEKIAKGLVFHEEVIVRNLRQFGPFAALELVLAQAGHNGADRQAMHEILRDHAQTAQSVVWQGEQNPLQTLLTSDSRITSYLQPAEIATLFSEVMTHVGDAPERAQQLVNHIRETIIIS